MEKSIKPGNWSWIPAFSIKTRATALPEKNDAQIALQNGIAAGAAITRTAVTALKSWIFYATPPSGSSAGPLSKIQVIKSL
jgi:hypothetical protein